MAKVLLVVVSVLTVITIGLSSVSASKKKPEVCEFYYANGTGKSRNVCSRISLTAVLNVVYKDNNKKSHYLTEPLPCSSNETINVNVTGDCGVPAGSQKTESKLILSWGGNEKEDFELTFYFSKRSKKQHMYWNIVNITVSFFTDSFEDSITASDEVIAVYNGTLFEGLDYTRSYMCDAKKNLTMINTNRKDSTIVHLTLENFRVQAFEFKNATSGDYGVAYRCTSDQNNSKIVPIAVGAALAGLVLVVLVAYIVGRLRNRRQSSYEALS